MPGAFALLLLLAIGAGVSLAAYGGLEFVATHRRTESRLRRLAGHEGSGRQRRDGDEPDLLAVVTLQLATWLGLGRTPDLAVARTALQRAGFGGSHAAEIYLLARIVLPLVLGLIAVVIAHLRGMGGTGVAGSVGVAALIGHMAPGMMVSNLTKRRQAALTKALPDGIDLLVVCVESGLGINEAFVRVGRELQRAHKALANEFAVTAAELSLLPDRVQALENLYTRTGLDRLRGLVTTLMQAERFGTPVAQSLRLLAAEFRTRRMLAAEERAARLPVLLTIPMMVFILPVLFIVLLGPAVLTTLNTLAGM